MGLQSIPGGLDLTTSGPCLKKKGPISAPQESFFWWDFPNPPFIDDVLIFSQRTKRPSPRLAAEGGAEAIVERFILTRFRGQQRQRAESSQ